MSIPNHNSDHPALEEQLQQKLEQFAKAESEGTSHHELIQIYKELKDLRYQITISGPGSKSRNQTSPAADLQP